MTAALRLFNDGVVNPTPDGEIELDFGAATMEALIQVDTYIRQEKGLAPREYPSAKPAAAGNGVDVKGPGKGVDVRGPAAAAGKGVGVKGTAAAEGLGSCAHGQGQQQQRDHGMDDKEQLREVAHSVKLQGKQQQGDNGKQEVPQQFGKLQMAAGCEVDGMVQAAAVERCSSNQERQELEQQDDSGMPAGRAVVHDATVEWLFIGAPGGPCLNQSSSTSSSACHQGEVGQGRSVERGRRGSDVVGVVGTGTEWLASGGRACTVGQLQQILELLLLVWPAHDDADSDDATGAVEKEGAEEEQQLEHGGKKSAKQGSKKQQPQGVTSSSKKSSSKGEKDIKEDALSGECAVEWLLLLAVLLQQAPSEAKVELLQRRGTLLLQLLYHVLLQDPALGGRMVSGLQVTSRAAAAEMMADAAAAGEGAGKGVRTHGVGDGEEGGEDDYPLHLLVLLVLQSLVYEPVAWEVLEEEVLEGARLLKNPSGGLRERAGGQQTRVQY